jgi:hypothetical protein
MFLRTLALLAPLVSLAAADTLEVKVDCDVNACSYLDGAWHSAFGTHYVNGADGCHDPPYVPGLNNLCLDWAHGRAHFYFDNQGKRCLRLDRYDQPDFCAPNRNCFRYWWEEVACTW